MKLNGRNYSLGTILFILFIILILAVVIFNLIFLCQKQNAKTLQELTKIKKELVVARKNYWMLEVKMNGIKDKDDLLRRDMFMYIDQKYQMIPRIVALAIAKDTVAIAKKEHISPELIFGVMEVESSFNPMAKSSKKARGLMQVMPEWVSKLGLSSQTDLYDIYSGIYAGAKILQIYIIKNNGSISKALYDYVNKDSLYPGKVYEAMGRFVAFRSTVDNSNPSPITSKTSISNDKENKDEIKSK